MMVGTVDSEEQAKMRELIIYLCRKSEEDDRFGATKLNKLLFFSDFAFYFDHHKSITGQEYQNLNQGPAPRAMKPLLDWMQNEGDVMLMERQYYGHKQKKLYATREADLSKFSGEEIAMVDLVIDKFRLASAGQISEVSHRFTGWKLTRLNDTIPYASVYLDDRPLTQEEKDFAATLDLTGVAETLAAAV